MPVRIHAAFPQIAARIGRSGFTLAELIVAMALTAIIGAVALPFLVHQTRAVASTAGYLDAQQSVSFALNYADHDLRLAGSGTAFNQPSLVEATPLAVTFNAALYTSDTSALATAAYYDPSIPDSMATLLTPATKITLPLSAVTYPDSTYYQSGGLPSSAETISLYVAKDSSSPIANTYILWRRVNRGTPLLLARNLVLPVAGAVFQYYTAGNGTLPQAIAPAQLPAYFSEPQNTSADSLLGQISEVSVQLTAVYQDPLLRQHFRSTSQVIPLLNAGLGHVAQCGAPPQPVSALTVTAYTGPSAGDTVKVSWQPSPDETGGAHDVRNYVVYRRPAGTATWDAIMTVPAGATPPYVEFDTGLTGGSYDYAIAAEDCTPSLSSLVEQLGVTAQP